MTHAVEVKDLVKTFETKSAQVRAVNGVSFSVAQGEIFGFLGPNGAGKTTTLEVIEGLQSATSGSITVLGLDIATQTEQVKRRIGVQLQEQSYFKHLRLRELLVLFGDFYGMKPDADALLDSVGLTEKARSLVKELSGGQALRFSIAASLVNDPEVLFLDEPTSGLDPQARQHLWEMVTGIRNRGTTVVLTTHYMEEAEALCDRVAIIDNGKIQALDTPLALVQQLDSAYHFRFTTNDAVSENALLAIPGAVRLTNSNDAYDLEVHSSAEAMQEFSRSMKDKNLSDFRIEPSTLEEVFLSLTGRELRD
ncbi:MAG: ABC transporter ATP-binding protein [Actinomycetota bacterium]